MTKREEFEAALERCVNGLPTLPTTENVALVLALYDEALAKNRAWVEHDALMQAKPASTVEFANLLRAFGRAVEPNPDKPFSSLDMMVAWDAVLAAYEAERRRAEAAERREEELRDMNDRLQASLVLHNDPKTVTLDGDYFHEMEADRDRLAAIVERVKVLIVDGCQVDVNGGYYFDSRYAVKLDLALDPEEDK